MNPKENPPENFRLPHASVIIANYNYSKWIKDCVYSALYQDYPDKEIVLVDDQSTDDSWETILELFRKDDSLYEEKEDFTFLQSQLGDVKFTAIQMKVNSGPSICRNVAIQSVFDHTHLFAVLDSDDIWLPTRLSKMVAKVLESPNDIGVVYTDNTNLDVKTGNLTREYRQSFDRRMLFNHNMIHSGGLISRLAFQKVGLYDSNFRLAEDLDLWLRISEHMQIVHIPESLVVTRVHENNTTNTSNREKWNQAWAYISEKTNKRLQQMRHG